MGVQRGLLSRVAAGQMHAGRSGASVDVIIDHLRAILNTRLGQAPSSPEFGIEHLSDLKNTFPDAIDIWKRSIRAAVDKYEPRLAQVTVREHKSDDPLTVVFEIRAWLNDGGRRTPVTLHTEVDPTGQFEIWS